VEIGVEKFLRSEVELEARHRGWVEEGESGVYHVTFGEPF
jgi:hypothetical protein